MKQNKKIINKIRDLLYSYFEYTYEDNDKLARPTIEVRKINKDHFTELKYSTSSMNKLLSEIFNDNSFKNKGTINDFKNIIINALINRLAKNHDSNIDDFVKNSSNYIYRDLANLMDDKIFKCWISISGLMLISNDIFETSYINIYSNSYREHEIKEATKGFPIIKQQVIAHNREELLRKNRGFLVQEDIDSIIYKSNFLKFSVISGTISGAKDTAITVANSFLNTLRIAENAFGWSGSNLSIGRDTKYAPQNDSIISLADDTQNMLFSNDSNEANFPFRYIEKDKFLNIMINRMNSIFKNVSEHTDLTSFEQAMFIANNFIGDALHSSSNDLKVVNFVSSIETFLEEDTTDKKLKQKIDKLKYSLYDHCNDFDYLNNLINSINLGESITNQLKKRITSLIMDSKSDKKSIKEFKTKISKIYNLRSRISHGEKHGPISPDDLNELKTWSISIFYFMIINFKSLNNTEPFKAYIKKYIKNKFNLTDNELKYYI